MGATKRASWLIGTVLVALVLLAGAWFLLIGPNVTAIGETKDEIESTLAQNTVQETRLATLKEQFAELPTYKAQLAALQTQIPVEDGEPNLLREIHAQATAAGVTVLSFTVTEEPSLFFAAEPLVDPNATAAPAEEEATDEEGTTGTQTTEAAPVGVNGFVRIPVDVVVLGSYANTVTMIDGLQQKMSRLFLVTSLKIEGKGEEEAANGRPATVEGDAEVTISGFVYVLAPGSTGVADAGDAGTGSTSAGEDS